MRNGQCDERRATGTVYLPAAQELGRQGSGEAWLTCSAAVELGRRGRKIRGSRFLRNEAVVERRVWSSKRYRSSRCFESANTPREGCRPSAVLIALPLCLCGKFVTSGRPSATWGARGWAATRRDPRRRGRVPHLAASEPSEQRQCCEGGEGVELVSPHSRRRHLICSVHKMALCGDPEVSLLGGEIE